MAKFTDTDIGGIQTQIPIQQGSAAPAASPAASNSNVVGAALGGVANLVTVGANLYADMNKKETNKNLAEFTNQQLKLADAVDQGRLSSDEARMRMRANFSQALTNNPNYADTLMSVHKNLISTSGLANVISTGTPEEIQRERTVQSAYDKGFIKNGASDKDIAKGLQSYEDWNESVRNMQTESAKLSLATDRTKAEASAQQLKVEGTLRNFASQEYNRLSNEMQGLMSTPLGPNGNREEIISWANTQQAGLMQIMNDSGGLSLNAETRNALVKPFELLFDEVREFGKGTRTADVLKNNIDIMQSNLKLSVLHNNPKFAAQVALVGLAPNSVPLNEQLGMMGQNIAADMVSDNEIVKPDGTTTQGNPPNFFELEPSEQKDIFKIFGENMKYWESGNSPLPEEDVKKSFGNFLQNVMQGTNFFALQQDDPKQYGELIKFLASKDFKMGMEKYGQEIPSDVADKFNQVVQSTYNDNMINAVRQHFDKQKVFVVDKEANPNDPTTKPAFVVKFENGQIKFDYSEAAKKAGGFMASEKVGGIFGDTQLDTVNKKLETTLNNSLRAIAHMGGISYEEAWNQIKPQLFPDAFNEGQNSPMGAKENTGDTIDQATKPSITEELMQQDIIKSGYKALQDAITSGKELAPDVLYDLLVKPTQEAMGVKTKRVEEGTPTSDGVQVEEGTPTSNGVQKVDDTFIDKLSMIESSGNPNAVSPAGAMGLYQIMPSTAADPGFGVKPLSTGRDVAAAPISEQKRFSKDYLNAMLERYDGNMDAALVAYNAGPGVADKFVKGGSLPKETQDYLQKFKDGQMTEANFLVFLPDAVNEGFTTLTGINPTPQALQSFATSLGKGLIDRVVGTKSDTVSISEKDFNSNDMEVLRGVVKSVLEKGKSTISYEDWADDALKTIDTNGKDKIGMTNKVISLFTDPSTDLAMTLGAASIVEEDGKIYVKDVYDFNEGPKGREAAKVMKEKGLIGAVSYIVDNKSWSSYTKMRVLGYLLQPQGKKVESKILIGTKEELKNE